jgi:diguanylate cyclase (GGDEF)-like protein
MPETTIDQAQILGERLRAALAGDQLLREHGVTGSVGVASFPLHGASIEDIIRQADQAMYCSKSEGGDRVSVPVLDQEGMRESQAQQVGI